MSTLHPSSAARRNGSLVGLTALAMLCVGLSACADATTAPPSDTSAVATAGVAALPRDGELDPGTYLANNLAVPLEITVPEGWMSNDDVLYKTDAEETGSGVFVTFKNVGYVPTDACAWRGTITEIDPSVDGFADAMAAQKSSTTTEPVELTGDHRALEFDFAVDEGIDIADCDGGRFCLHSESPDTCTRWYSTATERESYRVVAVNGERIVMSVGTEGSVDETLAAEARVVFASINDLH